MLFFDYNAYDVRIMDLLLKRPLSHVEQFPVGSLLSLHCVAESSISHLSGDTHTDVSLDRNVLFFLLM